MEERKTVRVMLTLEDFRELVRGKVVKRQNVHADVEIALSDIGWHPMLQEIAEAAHEADKK